MFALGRPHDPATASDPREIALISLSRTPKQASVPVATLHPQLLQLITLSQADAQVP